MAARDAEFSHERPSHKIHKGMPVCIRVHGSMAGRRGLDDLLRH